MTQAVWKRAAILAVLAAGITLAVVYRDLFNVERVTGWVETAGIWAPLVFMLVYMVATVFFLPGLVFTIAGGALFGPVWGTLINLTGATAGAVVAFIVARYVAGDWVRQKAGGRLTKLMDGVADEGWRFVAFVRLVPLFPFNMLNYALGLTPIRLGSYAVATFVFMLPGAAAYTYVGFAGREALAGGESVIQHGLLALALLAMVAFLPRVIKAVRNKPIPGEEDLENNRGERQ